MYPLNKQENYRNLGGINQKASEYITGEGQVLDLRNYAFEKPGAWISRPGYTGFATLNAGQSFAPLSLFEFIKTSGASYVLYNSGNTLYSLYGNSALIDVQGQSAPLDFEVYNDNAYFANGKRFGRYSGTLAVYLNQPYNYFSETFAVGGATIRAGWTPTFNAGGISIGTYQVVLAYINDEGTVGPAINNYGATTNVVLPLGVRSIQSVVSLTNFPAGSFYFEIFGITIPPGYYGPTVFVQPYFIYTPTGSTVTLTDQFFSIPQNPGGYALQIDNPGGVTTYKVRFPLGAGQTTVTDNILFSLAPRYISLYNNMFVYSGQSVYTQEVDSFAFNNLTLSALSKVFVSNIAEPEYISPESEFDVRTNNGDYNTGSVVFQEALVVFKNSSTHELRGFSPETLELADVNLDYGCVNNEAFVTFENKLWFMDKEGIAEYAGANTTIISYKIEPSLNECDKETCKAFHLKKYHQVWFTCRITGSTNFRTFVYDYSSDQWTIYDTFYNISAMALKQTLDQDEVMFYAQNASQIPKFMIFGESLSADDSFEINHSIKTKFHKRATDGDTTQEMWRRLYINNDIESASIIANVNFRKDYGSSIVKSATMGLTEFQSRIDYGISARSLSAEIIINSTQPIRINGYTLESRYLRSV